MSKTVNNRKKDLFAPEVLSDFVFRVIQQHGAANVWACFVEHQEYRCFERQFLPSDCECAEKAHN